MNHVDWLITIGVFLVFVAWAFSFYFSFFPDSRVSTSDFADIINEKVIDYLFIESYRVEGSYYVAGLTTEVVMNITYAWPNVTENTKNSTRVYLRTPQGTTAQPDCIISGDNISFKTDFNAGTSYIIITYSNASMPMRCSGTFNVTTDNRTNLGVAEKTDIISQVMINEMTNFTYEDFKNNLSVSRDFRVEINTSGVYTNFGSPLPKNRDIYVRETFSRLEETDAEVDVRVLIW